MQKFKKDKNSFKPRKGLKPKVKFFDEDEYDLPWNCYEWDANKRKYGKKALYKTAMYKDKFVYLIDITEKFIGNRKSLFFTINYDDVVKCVPEFMLKEFSL